jgi:ABC-type multidrug transport system ATPase subunit
VSTDAAIQVTGLRKSYGEVAAVRGIDFRVEPGISAVFLKGERINRPDLFKQE